MSGKRAKNCAPVLEHYRTFLYTCGAYYPLFGVIMLTWQTKPTIYQINTWVWLHSLSQRYGTAVGLHNVPDEVLDNLAAYGFDAVWLMG
ncbi:MAG: hypothetical protein CUN53_13945, partial [Phototrophicales bacterium]